jgi:hypothetical protein
MASACSAACLYTPFSSYPHGSGFIVLANLLNKTYGLVNEEANMYATRYCVKTSNVANNI